MSPREQRAPRADGRAGAHVHAPEDDLVAVEPPPRQVHLGLDGRAVAHREEPGDGRERVQVDALSDRRPEGPGVVRDPGRAGEGDRPRRPGELLCGPQPHVHPAAPRVPARTDAAQEQASPRRRQAHASERRHQDHPPGADHPPRHGGRPSVRAGPGQEAVEREEPHQPPQADDRLEGQREQHQEALRGPGRAPHPRPFLGLLDRLHRGDVLRLGVQARKGVHVADGDLRVAGAQGGHELRRRQAAAAELEEVGAGVRHRRAEHVRPALREPGDRRRADGLLDRRARGGQRPGERVSVHLPRGAGGQIVDHGEQGYQRGGERRAQLGAGHRQVERRRRPPARGSPPAPGCRRRSSAPRRPPPTRRAAPAGRHRPRPARSGDRRASPARRPARRTRGPPGRAPRGHRSGRRGANRGWASRRTVRRPCRGPGSAPGRRPR